MADPYSATDGALGSGLLLGEHPCLRSLFFSYWDWDLAQMTPPQPPASAPSEARVQRSKGERQRLLVEMLGDAKPKKEPKPERAPQPWCALFLLGTLVLSYAAVALHVEVYLAPFFQEHFHIAGGSRAARYFIDWLIG